MGDLAGLVRTTRRDLPGMSDRWGFQRGSRRTLKGDPNGHYRPQRDPGKPQPEPLHEEMTQVDGSGREANSQLRPSLPMASLWPGWEALPAILTRVPPRRPVGQPRRDRRTSRSAAPIGSPSATTAQQAPPNPASPSGLHPKPFRSPARAPCARVIGPGPEPQPPAPYVQASTTTAAAAAQTVSSSTNPALTTATRPPSSPHITTALTPEILKRLLDAFDHALGGSHARYVVAGRAALVVWGLRIAHLMPSKVSILCPEAADRDAMVTRAKKLGWWATPCPGEGDAWFLAVPVSVNDSGTTGNSSNPAAGGGNGTVTVGMILRVTADKAEWERLEKGTVSPAQLAEPYIGWVGEMLRTTAKVLHPPALLDRFAALWLEAAQRPGVAVVKAVHGLAKMILWMLRRFEEDVTRSGGGRWRLTEHDVSRVVDAQFWIPFVRSHPGSLTLLTKCGLRGPMDGYLLGLERSTSGDGPKNEPSEVEVIERAPEGEAVESAPEAEVAQRASEAEVVERASEEEAAQRPSDAELESASDAGFDSPSSPQSTATTHEGEETIPRQSLLEDLRSIDLAGPAPYSHLRSEEVDRGMIKYRPYRRADADPWFGPHPHPTWRKDARHDLGIDIVELY
ncbi:hypothetical protein N656DRAFT_224664 [Canariomyces notabilis]|uniref:Uncharacterized protein n=1 Tax=Canariomyces notabilis TaxID=2074819 RepID=A0AAN6YWH5_9PEZI|nr:hypothetical protein N656DRAFT_224664 [Canariomyces arenarius]